MPELKLQASRDCRALSPDARRRRCRVSLSFCFSLFVVSVNVNVAALHGNSLSFSLACSPSLCGSTSRSVLYGKVTCCHWRNFIACLPVLSVCLLAALSAPLASLHCPLSLSLPLSSFALNTLARQCDAFVMKRISGIRCLCVGNLGVSVQLCPTWLCRVVVEEVP